MSSDLAGSLEITLPGGVRKTFIVERPREFDAMIDTSDEVTKG